MKLSREQQIINTHLKAAKAYGELSYAKRLKVGALIVKEDRVISTGRNGTPTGRDNDCEYISYNVHGEPILVTKLEVCHAEMNAILFAARNGTSTNGCSLIVTHSPCFECSKMIVQCGIKEVYYDKEYRDLSAIDFLKECGIKVEKINNKLG